METSNSKGSWSVLAKKVNREPPSTPSLRRSQFRTWNQCNPEDAGPSKHPTEASPRPRFGMHANANSPKPRVRVQPVSESVMLPGFQNAFIPPSSDRGLVRRLDKGKAKETAPLYESEFTGEFHLRSSPPSSPIGLAESEVRMHVDRDGVGLSDSNAKLDLEMLGDDADEQLFDNFEGVGLHNWRAEVCC